MPNASNFPLVLAAWIDPLGRILPILFLGLLFVFVGFFVLLFAIYLWETYPLHAFIPITVENTAASPGTRPDPLNYRGEFSPPPYVEVNNEHLRGADFLGPTTGRHAKGGTYRLVASLWLSPQCDVLVITSAGNMMRAPFRATSLETRVGDRLFITRDEWGSPDVSGIADIVVVKNADVPELLTAHRARLSPVAHAVRPYDGVGLDEAHRENNRRRATAMEALGLAKFINPTRDVWRHTFRGAVAAIFASVRWINESQQGDPDERRMRMRRPRPGDEKYRPDELPPAANPPLVAGKGPSLLAVVPKGHPSHGPRATPPRARPRKPAPPVVPPR